MSSARMQVYRPTNQAAGVVVTHSGRLNEVSVEVLRERAEAWWRETQWPSQAPGFVEFRYLAPREG